MRSARSGSLRRGLPPSYARSATSSWPLARQAGGDRRRDVLGHDDRRPVESHGPVHARQTRRNPFRDVEDICRSGGQELVAERAKLGGHALPRHPDISDINDSFA